MTRPRLLILSLLVLFPLILCAQSRRPSPGTGISAGNVPRMTGPGALSRVEVSITSQDSRPLAIQALVEIGGLGGGTNQQTYTDPEGRVSFSLPAGKAYQLKVSGPGIEPTVVQFEVNTGETFHRENIAVNVRSADAKNSPGGTVSANLLKVPEKARAEFEKGMKDLGARKLQEAKKHFLKASEEYPKYDWAFNNIGVIDMQLNDPTGARAAFTHAVELNDKNPDATKNLARLKIQDMDFAGAKELLIKSLTVQPGNPDTLVLLAYSQLKTKDLDAALANAEKCHTAEPDLYPLSHLIAGAVREMKGDREGAEKQYQVFLKEAPNSPQAKSAQEGLARLQARANN